MYDITPVSYTLQQYSFTENKASKNLVSQKMLIITLQNAVSPFCLLSQSSEVPSPYDLIVGGTLNLSLLTHSLVTELSLNQKTYFTTTA